jgi:cell division protein FtsL
MQQLLCNIKVLCGQANNMTTGNEVNDVNSPVQTQESEMGDAELQLDANRYGRKIRLIKYKCSCLL